MERERDSETQPLFGPPVGSRWHPCITTTNLSYRFPIFDTSAWNRSFVKKNTSWTKKWTQYLDTFPWELYSQWLLEHRVTAFSLSVSVCVSVSLSLALFLSLSLTLQRKTQNTWVETKTIKHSLFSKNKRWYIMYYNLLFKHSLFFSKYKRLY